MPNILFLRHSFMSILSAGTVLVPRVLMHTSKLKLTHQRIAVASLSSFKCISDLSKISSVYFHIPTLLPLVSYLHFNLECVLKSVFWLF